MGRSTLIAPGPWQSPYHTFGRRRHCIFEPRSALQNCIIISRSKTKDNNAMQARLSARNKEACAAGQTLEWWCRKRGFKISDSLTRACGPLHELKFKLLSLTFLAFSQNFSGIKSLSYVRSTQFRPRSVFLGRAQNFYWWRLQRKTKRLEGKMRETLWHPIKSQATPIPSLGVVAWKAFSSRTPLMNHEEWS